MPYAPKIEGTSELFKDIVKLCDKKGISLTQLCRELDIPYHQLAKFKKGSKDLELISLIQAYLK